MAEVPRKWWNLFVLIPVLLWIAVAAYVVLRSNAWIPESAALTESELGAKYPGWMQEGARAHVRSPDKTRVFNPQDEMDNDIYDAANPRFEGRLFDFTIRDQESEWFFVFHGSTDDTPIHFTCGFIDDNHCVMGFVPRHGDITPHFRVWRRRFPEWWWGNAYRWEAWVLALLTALLVKILYPYSPRKSKILILKSIDN